MDSSLNGLVFVLADCTQQLAALCLSLKEPQRVLIIDSQPQSLRSCLGLGLRRPPGTPEGYFGSVSAQVGGAEADLHAD